MSSSNNSKGVKQHQRRLGLPATQNQGTRQRSGSASSVRSSAVSSAPSSVEDFDAPSPETLRDAALRPYEYQPNIHRKVLR